MSPEEVEALLAENATLRTKMAALRLRQVALTQQLQAALVRLAELEQEESGPPPCVKPKRSSAPQSQAGRKKRAPEHNTSRKRSPPTRIERHVLEHCPGCQYQLRGENGHNGHIWTTACGGPQAVRHYAYSLSRGHQLALAGLALNSFTRTLNSIASSGI
jgi:hypothetical protein